MFVKIHKLNLLLRNFINANNFNYVSYCVLTVEPQSLDVMFHRNLIEKMSTCKFEYDIIAKFILNKLSLENINSSEHINPGISSIWQDERRRRDKLESSQIPPIQKEIPEGRPNAQPTESDLFFRRALVEKLRRIDEDPDFTFNISLDTTNLKNSKKFNLKALLSNAAYPAESSQIKKSQLIDASFIDNPYRITSEPLQKHPQDDSDVTMIDEDIVISLSQQRPMDLDKSFSPEEIQFLEVLRLLENNDNQERDNDSLLAPLTQVNNSSVLSQLSNQINLSQNYALTQRDPVMKEKSPPSNNIQIRDDKDESYDSDDDLLNDFSFVMNDYNVDGGR